MAAHPREQDILYHDEKSQAEMVAAAAVNTEGTPAAYD